MFLREFSPSSRPQKPQSPAPTALSSPWKGRLHTAICLRMSRMSPLSVRRHPEPTAINAPFVRAPHPQQHTADRTCPLPGSPVHDGVLGDTRGRGVEWRILGCGDGCIHLAPPPHTCGTLCALSERREAAAEWPA